MDQRRKVTLAALFVMTVLLAGISVFITLRIQQNNSPDDADASGFGDKATRDLYDNVAEAFDTQTCETLLDKTFLAELSTGLTYTSTVTPKIEDYPKVCNYVFNNGVEGAFSLFAYKTNSYIPADEEELYDAVNSPSISQQESVDTLGSILGFYGTNYGDENCRLNLFNTQNEFYYASMVYTTTDACDSTEMAEFNLNVFSVLSRSIDQVIVDVTKAGGKVPN